MRDDGERPPVPFYEEAPRKKRKAGIDTTGFSKKWKERKLAEYKRQLSLPREQRVGKCKFKEDFSPEEIRRIEREILKGKKQ